MVGHIWAPVLHESALAATWIDARLPAAVPRWVWAGLLVLAAAVVGRIGGKVLAGLMQLALIVAAVVVAWQMVRTPAPTRAAAPMACVLEGTCAASTPPGQTSGAGPGATPQPSPQAGAQPSSIGLAAVR